MVIQQKEHLLFNYNILMPVLQAEAGKILTLVCRGMNDGNPAQKSGRDSYQRSQRIFKCLFKKEVSAD